MSKVPLIIISALLICFCIFPAAVNDPILAFDSFSGALNSFTSPFMGAVSDIFRPPVEFTDIELAENICYIVHVYNDQNRGYWQFERIDFKTGRSTSNLRITYDGKFSSGNVPFLDFVGAGLLSVSPTFPKEIFGTLDSFNFTSDFRYLDLNFIDGILVSGSPNVFSYSIEIDRGSFLDFKLLIDKSSFAVTVMGV